VKSEKIGHINDCRTARPQDCKTAVIEIKKNLSPLQGVWGQKYAKNETI